MQIGKVEIVQLFGYATENFFRIIIADVVGLYAPEQE
jgi:hypothetical protein